MAPSSGSDGLAGAIAGSPEADNNVAADEELQRKLEELHLSQPPVHDGSIKTSTDRYASTNNRSRGHDKLDLSAEDVTYRNYKNEDDLDVIIALVAPYLSEPYSVYCYRYFLHGWPQLCILAHHQDFPVGVIVCKQDRHRGKLIRGYIAMLSTHPKYRKLGIASTLVKKVIQTMLREGAQEIVLETEVSNTGALNLYQKLGFIRLKRLYRFYLNASDAFRLVLPVPKEEWQVPPPGLYDDDPDLQRPGTPVEWQRQAHQPQRNLPEESSDDEGADAGKEEAADQRLRMGLYDSIYA